jgi:type I restriction enzyme R subunit
VKVILSKRDNSQQRQTDEQRELAIRQIVNSAIVSEAGRRCVRRGRARQAEHRHSRRRLPRRGAQPAASAISPSNCWSGCSKARSGARFAGNVVQAKKFSELLTNVIKRYQNRAIETAQVIEELIEMARKFRAAANRGEALGLTEDEVRFYDALADNESAVRELSDETLKKIAHELTENLRQNITVDWSARESIRARLRLMVKRILRKYRYPPDQQEAAIELVLQQAEVLGEEWM